VIAIRSGDRKGRFFPKAGEVARLLRDAYPDTDLGNQRDPLDETAFVILSGQTNEKIFEETFRNFKSSFPRWEMVERARIRDLERPLRKGGLSNQKARYLRELARQVRRDFGVSGLAPIAKMKTEAAETYLCSLPGVGIKTARCFDVLITAPRFPSRHPLSENHGAAWLDSLVCSPV